MRRRGLNAQQIMLACEQEIQAQCGGGLSAAEFAAVREPSCKKHAMEFERMLAKGIAERDGLIANIATCTFSRVSHRNRDPTTLYARDYDDIDDLIAHMDNRIWLNGTKRNEGADHIAYVRHDPREKEIFFDLRQTKMGNSTIGCATGPTNANNSMIHIAAGMDKAINHAAGAIEQLHDYTAYFYCSLDTTRRVIDEARALASKESLAINGADELWPIWQAPVREAAIAVHGAHAKTFGVPK